MKAVYERDYILDCVKGIAHLHLHAGASVVGYRRLAMTDD